MFQLWFILISAFSLAGSLWAQNATVSVSISDPSGASIPKAKITVRNLATNVATVTSTNKQGLLFLPPVAPGKYQLTASAAGFSDAYYPAPKQHTQTVAVRTAP